MIKIREAEMRDAEAVAAALYRPDREFIDRLGLDHAEAVGRSLSDSTESWAIDKDGEALGLFGIIASPQKGCGNVWLLGTDALFTKHRMWFVRRSAVITSILRRRWHTLDSLVDEANRPLNRWVEWLGFSKIGQVTDAVGRTLNKWRLI